MKQYQSEAINDLAAALAKAQAEMTHASKDAKNPHLKSKYADLSAVIDAARPHLAKNGLSVVQVTDPGELDTVVLMTQLSHASGQWVRGWYPVKPVKNDPQGFGSALTYARRYSYAAIVGVAASGEDDDGNAASGGSPAAPKTEPEYRGVFDTRDLLDAFVKSCVAAIGRADNLAEVKSQKTLNLAKWGAMKDSSNAPDREGYERIVAAYNEAFAKYQPKPTTVDAAKGAASLPADVANDPIPL
jgi:hypothetical protein